MHPLKMIGKREFIQHTSKYLKYVEDEGKELIITHHNKPDLVLTKIKVMTFKQMRAFADVKIHGDINEPVLPGYDEW